MSTERQAADTTSFWNEKYRTFIPTSGAISMSTGDKPRALTHETALGYDVFRWPEFRALAERLMIDLESPVTVVTIRVPVDECVDVTVVSNGQDLTKPKE